MADATEYAWAAGFLDGEGCFRLAPRSGCHAATRCPSVSACQIKREPLEKLSGLFGGKVRSQRVNDKGEQIWQWEIASAASVAECILMISPYIVGKRKDSRIVLAYALLMGSRGRIYTEDDIAARMTLIKQYEELRAA